MRDAYMCHVVTFSSIVFLLLLLKQHSLCSNRFALQAILFLAQCQWNPIHAKCLEIFVNFSKLPSNNGILADFPGMIPFLVDLAMSSGIVQVRVSALRCLQNISTNPKTMVKLATNESLLVGLTTCCRQSEVLEETEAATAILYNLSTNPNAVGTLACTQNVIAALMHGANKDPASSPSKVRLLSIDALATISMWLQTSIKKKISVPLNESPTLPTHQSTGWKRWD